MNREKLEKLVQDAAKARQADAVRAELEARERRDEEQRKTEADYQLAIAAYAAFKDLFAEFKLPESGHELQVVGPPGQGQFKGFSVGITHWAHETGDYPKLIALFAVSAEDGLLVLTWDYECKREARYRTVEGAAEKAAEVIGSVGLDYLRERFAHIKQQRNRGQVFVA